MPEPKSARIWVIAAVSVIIVLAAGVTLLELDSSVTTSSPSSGAQSSTSTAVTSLTTSTNVSGTSKLSLRLRINSTTLTVGQNLSVSISDFNSADTSENVSVAAKWPISNLTLYACGTLDFPFGVAIIKGNYDEGNLSSGATLQVVEGGPQSCQSGPNFTNYYFEPNSDKATLSGGCVSSSSCEQPFYMSQTIVISGYWTGGVPVPMEPTAPSILHPLQPGEYTVVGGDEWGEVAILHFVVKA